jgi:hypothetical protein
VNQPPEAKRVRDLGEEGGPHEVETYAYGPRACATVAARRGVSALVEDRRHQEEAQDHQHQRGVVEQLADPATYAVHEEQPNVQRDQRPEHRQYPNG